MCSKNVCFGTLTCKQLYKKIFFLNENNLTICILSSCNKTITHLIYSASFRFEGCEVIYLLFPLPRQYRETSVLFYSMESVGIDSFLAPLAHYCYCTYHIHFRNLVHRSWQLTFCVCF